MAKSKSSTSTAVVEQVKVEVVDQETTEMLEGCTDFDSTLHVIVQQDKKGNTSLEALRRQMTTVLADYPDTTPTDLANHILGELGYRCDDHNWHGRTYSKVGVAQAAHGGARNLQWSSSTLYKLVSALKRKGMTNAILLAAETAKQIILWQPETDKVVHTEDSATIEAVKQQVSKLMKDDPSTISSLRTWLKSRGIVIDVQPVTTVRVTIKRMK